MIKKLNKTKTLFCLLFSLLALGAVFIGVSYKRLEQQATYAAEATVAPEGIKSLYIFGEEITVTAGVDMLYNETTYTATDAVLMFPDGMTYTVGKYELNQTGNYTITYSAKTDIGVLKAKKEFKVVKKNWEVTSEASTVTLGDITMTSLDSTDSSPRRGLTLVLADGDTFKYNVPFNISNTDVNDIITFFCEQVPITGVECKDIYVTLTDCYDENIKIDFIIRYGNSTTMASVSATGQSRVGLYRASTDERYPEVIIGGVSYRYYTGGGGARLDAAKSRRLIDNALTWQLDLKNQDVKISGTTTADGSALTELVSDLDNQEIFGNNRFVGFTTGEVYLSIRGQDYTVATTTIQIESIFGVSGDALSQAVYEDKVDPIIKVDYTPTTGKTVYAAKGKEFTIFNATALDVDLRQGVKAEVYYNYKNSHEIFIPIKNGKFTPNYLGKYTIVYTVSDASGNSDIVEIPVNCIDTGDKDPITIEKNKLQSLKAGVESTLPVCETEGINGAINVEIFVVDAVSNTTKIDPATRKFTPMGTGTYTVRYEYSDNVYGFTWEYTVESVASPEITEFLDKPLLPIRFIYGMKYNIDEYFAYTFTAQTPVSVATKVYARFDNASEYPAEEIDSKSFLISGEENVRFKYVDVVNGNSKESEWIPIVKVQDAMGMLLPQNYFDGDFDIADEGSALVFTAKSKSDSAFTFINPIALSSFNLEYVIPETSAYTKINIILTDYADLENQKVITYEIVKGDLMLSIDGGGGTKVATGALLCSGRSRFISYDYLEDKITNEYGTYHLGLNFGSQLCYVSVELCGITGDAEFELRRINNQSFAGLNYDFQGPTIQTNIEQVVADIGSTYTLPVAFVNDVLTPMLPSSLSVRIKSPSGATVVSVDSVSLDGECDATREYSFVLSEYGNYTITYVATDYFGNETRVMKLIRVLDKEAPTLSFDDGSNETTVVSIKLGQSHTVKNFVAYDNLDSNEALSVNAMLMNEYGVVAVVNKSSGVMQFKPDKAGLYKVYVYCIDTAGNTAYRYYYLKVE